MTPEIREAFIETRAARRGACEALKAHVREADFLHITDNIGTRNITTIIRREFVEPLAELADIAHEMAWQRTR